ncbi:MAG: acyltransferase [Bacteroidales bacterium]|nr:acyltransferase [Bacteroidales bacterium]
MEDTVKIEGLHLMGDNLRNKVKFIGEGVRLYPMCKIIHPDAAELDNNCQIMDFTFIDAGKLLKIGKYSTITWHCIIEGGAKTFIGDRVFIGPGSKLLTSTYELNGFYSVEHLPDNCGAIHYGDIVIKDDAYLGANVTVLPGVSIGEGAVVGANALVNKDIDPWGIYVGAPCKKIGERQKPTLERQEKIKEVNWNNHL